MTCSYNAIFLFQRHCRYDTVSYDESSITICDQDYWMLDALDLIVFQDKIYCRSCDVLMNNDGAAETHLETHYRLQWELDE